MGSAYNAGAIIDVTDHGKGSYTVTQVSEALTLPKPVEGRLDQRREISFDYGPVKITGYVDIDTLEIGVDISILGIKLGSFYGNLKDGVVVNVNLFVASGKVTLYLKGKEIWVSVDLKLAFDGEYKKDVKIFVSKLSQQQWAWSLKSSTQSVPSDPSDPNALPITLHAPPNTNIWPKPTTGNPLTASTAPIYHLTLPLKEFSWAKATLTANWSEKGDQGGLIFAIPGHSGSHTRWIKAAIEYQKGEPKISVADCNRGGEWTLNAVYEGEHAGTEVKQVSISMWRAQGGMKIWATDGKKFIREIREVEWAFDALEEDWGRECWVGIYAARSENREGLEGLEVGFSTCQVKMRDDDEELW